MSSMEFLEFPLHYHFLCTFIHGLNASNFESFVKVSNNPYVAWSVSMECDELMLWNCPL